MSDEPQADKELDAERSGAADEMEILTAWALRFDGYGYAAAVHLVLREVTTAYATHGLLPEDPFDQLAVFFGLQRWLGKWGGEYEPLHGRTWRRFRALFLKTCGVPVPERYRLNHWYEEWEQHWLPRMSEDVELVKRIHSLTLYDDSAVPAITV